MFAALFRSRLSSRRSLLHTVRWASQIPPKKPSSRCPLEENAKESSPQVPPSSSSEAVPSPEATQQTSSTSLPSLDFSPTESTGEPQTTGAKSSKGSLTSSERKRRVFSRVAMTVLALAFGANVVYMGREWDQEELKARKLRLEDAPSTRLGRTKERFTHLFDYFIKPVWPELLPPPYPPPHQKPYTLLLSLDDLLIKSVWDRENGWRTAKRPGVDYFLAYISQFYEVVIFTTQPSYIAIPIIEKLDRYRFFITYQLYREATHSINGKIVKDLSYLNRDLSKVIMLDTDPEHVMLQSENAIILPKWNGEAQDKGLIAIIPFLESIGIYKPPDVRPVLKVYEGTNIPLEYAKKEAEAKARHIEEWRSKRKGVPARSFTSLFGLSEPPVSTSRDVPPLTYLEQKRKEAQSHFQAEQEYIRTNRDHLEKLMEQDQQAMAAQVPSNLWEAIDQFSGKPKTPGDGSTTSTPTPPSSTSATTPSLKP